MSKVQQAVVGQRVLVANDPSWRDPVLGFVVRARGHLADIVSVTEAGIRYRASCFPRNKELLDARPADFWDGTNGVYEECALEKVSDVSALQEQIEQLKADFAQLATTVKATLLKK